MFLISFFSGGFVYYPGFPPPKTAHVMGTPRWIGRHRGNIELTQWGRHAQVIVRAEWRLQEEEKHAPIIALWCRLAPVCLPRFIAYFVPAFVHPIVLMTPKQNQQRQLKTHKGNALLVDLH